MVKPAITALLGLLCLLLVKANIDTFRARPPVQEIDSTMVPKAPAKKRAARQPLDLNPTMDPQLPDLSNGYLFNAQRFLAKEARSSKTGKGYAQNIRIEDVVFNGALLGSGYKKALVSYSSATPVAIRGSRTTTKKEPASRQETILLEVGDVLAGYTVKDIATDFILFVKGSDTIKKNLFDPDKKRQLVAPRPTSPPPPPQKPSGVAPLRRATPTPAKRPSQK